ncbi:hypothetical protein T492DRAFT_930269 [Pavlovales sp. CCMP2436]|nr:hypothetical protein T492DRAFT_930269 [Pavlovales sp. CCMP2436]
MVGLALALLPALAAGAAASGASRAAGRWHGFEQRFHGTSGLPLHVPEEYTPRADLEWGTQPFGFCVEAEWGGADGAGGVVEMEHVRRLLWCGCFIEGPTQTSERYTSSRVPRALPNGCWAAGDAAGVFALLPLSYKTALRLAELRGETPLLGEIGLLVPQSEGAPEMLCMVQLAQAAGGTLLLPAICTIFARAEADGAALAVRLDAEAKARADAAEEGGDGLALADGFRLRLLPADAPGSFSVRASWRGVAVEAVWREGRLAELRDAVAGVQLVR